LRITDTRNRVPGVAFLPGLEWDAFHLGQAFTTSDALNAAYQAGIVHGYNRSSKDVADARAERKAEAQK